MSVHRKSSHRAELVGEVLFAPDEESKNPAPLDDDANSIAVDDHEPRPLDEKPEERRGWKERQSQWPSSSEQ